MKTHVTLQVALTETDISQNLTISIFLEKCTIYFLFSVHIFIYLIDREKGGRGSAYIFDLLHTSSSS
jgi:hypothetical protein